MTAPAHSCCIYIIMPYSMVSCAPWRQHIHAHVLTVLPPDFTSVLQENGTVNVRTRDNVVHGMHKVADLVAVLSKERDSRSQASAFASHADSQQQEQQQQPAADS